MRTSTGRKQLRFLSQDGQACTFEYVSTVYRCSQSRSCYKISECDAKKLWEIKTVSKKVTQVGHLQNKILKREGQKVSYTCMKWIDTSKNILKPFEITGYVK